jgi:hypothetical protein
MKEQTMEQLKACPKSGCDGTLQPVGDHCEIECDKCGGRWTDTEALDKKQKVMMADIDRHYPPCANCGKPWKAHRATLCPTNRRARYSGSPLTATHRCKVCGALWVKWPDATWSLRSPECGACCDNAPMGDQIEDLDAAPAVPVDDMAQRLQDHMEQHHGICLKASEWDAAVLAALSQQQPAREKVCASCGFPWGLNPVRHAEFCHDRRLAALARAGQDYGLIERAFRKGHEEGFRAADTTSRSQASHVEDAWVAYGTALVDREA